MRLKLLLFFENEKHIFQQLLTMLQKGVTKRCKCQIADKYFIKTCILYIYQDLTLKCTHHINMGKPESNIFLELLYFELHCKSGENTNEFGLCNPGQYFITSVRCNQGTVLSFTDSKM